MVAIATLSEFASSIQQDVDTASASLYLLDLAQGLITEKIGDQNPWPSIAKATALAAATRAYANPQGMRSETVGGVSGTYNTPPESVGVYLTKTEKADLLVWLRSNDGSGAPTYAFPGTWPYPDPVERPADIVSG